MIERMATSLSAQERARENKAPRRNRGKLSHLGKIRLDHIGESGGRERSWLVLGSRSRERELYCLDGGVKARTGLLALREIRNGPGMRMRLYSPREQGNRNESRLIYS